ncbi:MAG TPA: GAF and ANTAR domain-containing protein [Mycobacteriales bacterium]|nr:GAF and ANTAR domain-containing protein [Mycobacteriales bacterium]
MAGGGDRAPSSDRIKALAEDFAAIGREVAESDGPAPVVVTLARLAVDRVPNALWASITTLRDGTFTTIAATDPRAGQADAIQYALGSGPCIDAALDDAIYNPQDLRNDERWPEFGRRVADELGVESMLCYRLALGVEGVIASMNIYSDRSMAFDDDAVAAGLLIAAHGGMAVTAATTREEAGHLRRALENSREIGVAMGVLMKVHGVTREQAFDLLRIASQSSNRKLRDIATDVADTGTIDLDRANLDSV